MSISLANPSIGRDSNVESMPDNCVDGRISRFADQILSLAPCMTRSLKFRFRLLLSVQWLQLV